MYLLTERQAKKDLLKDVKKTVDNLTLQLYLVLCVSVFIAPKGQSF